MATNLINNIDYACTRRINFMERIAFPSSDVRLSLFQSIFPDRAECQEELDFKYFADHFELSGSSIKDILVNAAYLAAGENTGMANRHIVEAVKLNYIKYGKLLTNEDFGYLAEG